MGRLGVISTPYSNSSFMEPTYHVRYNQVYHNIYYIRNMITHTLLTRITKFVFKHTDTQTIPTSCVIYVSIDKLTDRVCERNY